MANYVMSDIHGEYDKFLEMLEKIKFNERDTLYILGDIFDRGLKSLEIFDYIMGKENIKLVLGNHEKMFIDAYESLDFLTWLNNGGYTTYLQMLEKKDEHYIEKIYKYLKKLPLYYILKKKEYKYTFILVHAHIKTPNNFEQYSIEKLMSSQDSKVLLWEREGIFKEQLNDKYRIIFGHTPVNNISCLPIEESEILFYENKIALDCGVCYNGNLSCLDIDSFKTYYV